MQRIKSQPYAHMDMDVLWRDKKEKIHEKYFHMRFVAAAAVFMALIQCGNAADKQRCRLVIELSCMWQNLTERKTSFAEVMSNTNSKHKKPRHIYTTITQPLLSYATIYSEHWTFKDRFVRAHEKYLGYFHDLFPRAPISHYRVVHVAHRQPNDARHNEYAVHSYNVQCTSYTATVELITKAERKKNKCTGNISDQVYTVHTGPPHGISTIKYACVVGRNYIIWCFVFILVRQTIRRN